MAYKTKTKKKTVIKPKSKKSKTKGKSCKYQYMEKLKQIINHPLSKSVALGIVGALLLMEKHPLYAGVSFGMALRELLLAFKAD